jgi:hypothetical protein
LPPQKETSYTHLEQLWGAFDARKKASQGHDHYQFRPNDCANNGVLGISLCRDHLGGIPALAAIGQQFAVFMDGQSAKSSNCATCGSRMILIRAVPRTRFLLCASTNTKNAVLPLFATGLGGLSLLGWRRTRKAQVQTARPLIFEARCERKTGLSWGGVDNKTHSSMLAKFTPKKATCDEATYAPSGMGGDYESAIS